MLARMARRSGRAPYTGSNPASGNGIHRSVFKPNFDAQPFETAFQSRKRPQCDFVKHHDHWSLLNTMISSTRVERTPELECFFQLAHAQKLFDRFVVIVLLQ